MTQSQRIKGIILFEMVKVLEVIISIGIGFLLLIWLLPINEALAFIVFAIIAQGLCGVAYVVNKKYGVNHKLDIYWEPVNSWIKRSFLWLPGAR